MPLSMSLSGPVHPSASLSALAAATSTSATPAPIPAGAGQHDGTNLIVNYLPVGITEETLRTLFQPYGTIERCKIVNDKFTGMSLGYGFIKYDNIESAMAATAALNGYAMGNKRLKVSASKLPEKDKKANLYISGLPTSWQQQELADLVGQFGKVLEVRVLYDVVTHRCKGVGFARFETARCAAHCIAALNGLTLPGGIMPVNVRFADTTSDKIRKAMVGSGVISPTGVPMMGNATSPTAAGLASAGGGGGGGGSSVFKFNTTLAPSSNSNIAPPSVASPTLHALSHASHHQLQQLASLISQQQSPRASAPPTATGAPPTTNLVGLPSSPFSLSPTTTHHFFPSSGASGNSPGVTSAASPIFSSAGLLSQAVVAAAAAQQQQQQHQQQQQQQSSPFHTYQSQLASPALHSNHANGGASFSPSGSFHPTSTSPPTLHNGAIMSSALSALMAAASPIMLPTPTMHTNSQSATSTPNPSHGIMTAESTPTASPTTPTPFVGTCLFVYHLPLEATEQILFQLFSVYGEVTSAKVMRDLLTGRSKGFGFVNLKEEHQAQQAIAGLNGFQLGSKFIKVSFKTNSSPSPIGTFTQNHHQQQQPPQWQYQV